jgi:hypothetical protein
VQRLHDAERGAPLDGGEPAGVAHGHDPQAVALQQVRAALPHGQARGDVVVPDPQRRPQHGLRPLIEVRGGLVDAPGQVDGGRPGGSQPGDGVAVVPGEDHTERPGHAQRGRAPHGQPLDRLDELVHAVQAQHHALAGQPGLVDELHGAVHPVNGSHT